MELKIPAEEEFAACMESLAPKRSADRDEEEEDAPEAAGFLPSIAVLSQPNKKKLPHSRYGYGQRLWILPTNCLKHQKPKQKDKISSEAAEMNV